MNFSKRIREFSAFILLPIIFGFLSGCSGTSSSDQGELKMGSMDNLPGDVKSAPTIVQQAYQFATANPDVMKRIPCYCGCDDIGHTSNYACYIQSADQNGAITYDSHALGCSICVDITQDVMRLSRQGQSVSDLKAYIDQTYSQYGPSNIP
ncbi:MAG TPA: PCYCGC motif-containing (lipo)protein [Anaerolineales bacterium]|nr:PCYCGC motif-containing (lipo)protein [Anaerolineales bacterium]